MKMKLVSWMQSKFKGAQGGGGSSCISNEPREELWPNAFLAIGTLGSSSSLKAQREENQSKPEEISTVSSSSEEELSGFTAEEVGKLQKELTKLLSRIPTSIADILPLERFLNCPSSLEVDRRISSGLEGQDDLDIEQTISTIIGQFREIFKEQKKSVIDKKSILFLPKKMFICRSGFPPAPSLRDTLQESRMEKLLRTILLKKLYPQTQSSSRASSSVKRYLEDRPKKIVKKEDDQDKAGKSGKWDKTDSEYIVLEI